MEAHNLLASTGFKASRQPHPDSKVHGANMGPIWGRQDPGGPQVGPMNFAILVQSCYEKEFSPEC